ncbi:MAG TPA: LuxR C-terminal-related transcriptional regulator [Jatrophihabitans sp.]|nr:LuxR C-terminal-related transcriptional regulator [Jatrophihabitans sp.]
MTARPPSGTVTFLCTAIQDAVRRWDDAPAEMAAARQAHDRVVREAIESHGGHVFLADADGFRAAFATAGNAADAAVAAQRALRAHATGGFAVRMALHTCESAERDGEYAGNEIDRAVRLTALAHGGQILVSDAAEVLLRTRLSLRPLGERVLRGLRGRISVFQLVADGLPTEFPVLRSAEHFVGNLPRRVTSLIGRDDLVRDVAELIREHGLVTLTGVAGVGKTRTALEVGAELAGEFPDGVWVVELASVGDPDTVPAAMATVLGITPQGAASLITTIAGTLAGKRLLLVVDNCEHLLGAAASAIGTIVGRPGHVRVLATSREPLGVGGEQVLRVTPLPVAGGAASDAVTLFVDRARAVRSDFGLDDPDSTDAVTEICRTLDGLPLGIELAAARMAAMSAVEVRDRLTDRFRLLSGPTPGPHRQHTLQRAVAWSYDLLTADERELLRATSVFAGGFELASIHAIAPRGDAVDVLRLLDSLVRKSLIVADHTTASTRYALFETIRQFASDQLEAELELEATRDRHAAYFATEAVARWDLWDGPGWRDAVDWVETEFANLRAAFRWSSARGAVETATDIAAHAALMGFSVQLFEALAWAEELIPAAAAADVARLPRLCTGAGYACFAGRAEAARVNAHRAVELEGNARYDPCEPGYAMFVEALCQVYCGDLDRYVELTGEVVRRYGGERGYALASYVDGLQSAGRLEETLALTDEAVAAARRLGNPYWIAYALWIAGMALSRTNARRALAAWEQGVAFVHEHRVQFFEGFLARDAARLHTTAGEPDVALGLFADAIDAFHRAGNVPQLIITLASVPALFERLDRLAPAAVLTSAMSRERSSFHHVPELAELADRLAARLGATRMAELTTAGAELDLDAAARYAREQIDVACRDPVPRPGTARPGGLSRREIDVLRLVAAGRTSSEIAAELFISPRTAEHHVQHIYTKIGVSNRAAATRWAVTHHVVGGVLEG